MRTASGKFNKIRARLVFRAMLQRRELYELSGELRQPLQAAEQGFVTLDWLRANAKFIAAGTIAGAALLGKPKMLRLVRRSLTLLTLGRPALALGQTLLAIWSRPMTARRWPP